MSTNSVALTPAGNWRAGNEHEASSDHDNHQNRRFGVARPLYHRSDEGGDMHSPWRLFEERVRTGPYGLSRFPSQPHSPIRILILDGSNEERVNPRLRQFIRNSPPRIRGEWHLGLAPEPEQPGLTNDEFKKAMKKLKKQVYNPTYPRRSSWRKSLFSNSSSNTNIKITGPDADDGEKEEGKQCAICLESFVSNEQVLETPCNHMFHGDCLVPWVKSHGKCPVCRFALCERRENALALSNYNNNYGYNSDAVVGNDALAIDLIALIMAMEEAFNWVNLSR